MKVLSAAEMREVDRLTIEAGIPGLVLMENAGHRVVEFLAGEFAPLGEQRIVILCGKGNNGGDGFVIARQLFTRFRPQALHVVLAADPAELRGDAEANYRMLAVCGCPVERELRPLMRLATIVLDALLGTGLSGAARGPMAEWIEEVNHGFPLASIVAVDIPSGMASDAAASDGETVRADYTVTFTAPKTGQVLPPNCDRVGRLVVGAIGSPETLYENAALALTGPEDFAHLLAPREPAGHKGTYGHVLVAGGSAGKTGAPAMTGMAALRAGAGLVTVASEAAALPAIAAHAAELMTEVLSAEALERKDVVAIGPGLGTSAETVAFVRTIFAGAGQAMVVDAGALNALAGTEFSGAGRVRVLTPHPGEMARLLERKIQDRVADARAFAVERQVILVLKGQRTLIAFPDGSVWVNPTGTPAMGTGGSGDILTGLMAGLMAQAHEDVRAAVLGAVYLHGRAGELAARDLGEQCVVATDLLTYLPEAMDECRPNAL
ncbi:MAG: NAD(P)H-hydrate dehydratase [Acidobacteria bacterium]|nr:NAD(P)H-hydrate dehydratase [Acidobacteriota bacterium]